MCINVVANTNIAPNALQSSVFFSNPRLGRVHPAAPFPSGKVLRMHFKTWHEDPSLRERDDLFLWTEIRLLPEELDWYEFKLLALENPKRARRLIRLPKYVRVFFLPSHNTIPEAAVVRARKTRTWAIPIQSVPQVLSEERTFGGWYRDGHGCFLAYMMPLRPGPVKLLGGFSGLIYRVGVMKVIVDSKYALYLRCSDSEATQYACVLQQGRRDSEYEPIAVWLGAVPYVFPAQGFFFAPSPVVLPEPSFFGLQAPDDEYAFRLAEHILTTGFEFGPESGDSER